MTGKVQRVLEITSGRGSPLLLMQQIVHFGSCRPQAAGRRLFHVLNWLGEVTVSPKGRSVVLWVDGHAQTHQLLATQSQNHGGLVAPCLLSSLVLLDEQESVVVSDQRGWRRCPLMVSAKLASGF